MSDPVKFTIPVTVGRIAMHVDRSISVTGCSSTLQEMRKIDLTGKQFQDLIVLVEAGRKFGEVTWLCECRCGKRIEARSYYLRTGQTTSCGCRGARLLGEASTKHGDTGSSEYIVWRNMRSRCENPNDQSYKNYGGRGIKVCSRWSEYACFLEDMGRRPSPNHSIQRKDNDGPYDPSNCYWATRIEQNRNRRSTRKVGYKGRVVAIGALAEELGIPRATLYARYKRANWADDGWRGSR